MADVSVSIRRYIDRNLRVSMQDISASARTREWLKGRLRSVIAARERQPVLYGPEDFVHYGSYFKYTNVGVVDEYDMLVVIDSASGVFSRGGIAVGLGLGAANPNHKYSSTLLRPDGTGVSPVKLLTWLRGVAFDAVSPWGGAVPERLPQTVTVEIASSNVTVELAPAGIFQRFGDGSVFYNIPSQDSTGWVATSPRSDIARLDLVAAGRNDFRNVIRAVKRTAKAHSLDMPSFAIESAVVDYGCSHWWFNDLHLDFRGALQHVGRACRIGWISDPYDSTQNLLQSRAGLSGTADLFDWLARVLDALMGESNQAASDSFLSDAFEGRLI
jgi:hypothetical protein